MGLTTLLAAVLGAVAVCGVVAVFLLPFYELLRGGKNEGEGSD